VPEDVAQSGTAASCDARVAWPAVWLDWVKSAAALRERSKLAQDLRFALVATAAAMVQRYFDLEPDPEPQIRARRLEIPNPDPPRSENKSQGLRPESYFNQTRQDCQEKIAKTRLPRQDC